MTAKEKKMACSASSLNQTTSFFFFFFTIEQLIWQNLNHCVVKKKKKKEPKIPKRYLIIWSTLHVFFSFLLFPCSHTRAPNNTQSSPVKKNMCMCKYWNLSYIFKCFFFTEVDIFETRLGFSHQIPLSWCQITETCVLLDMDNLAIMDIAQEKKKHFFLVLFV